MKKTIGICSLVLAVGFLLPNAATAHEGSHEVVVKDNAFTPDVLPIDPGESVTWLVEEDNHTITSDDGLFDFSVKNGDTVQWPFPDEGKYPYYCRIHGKAMSGVIKVGDPDVPCDDCPAETRLVPSERFPTIASAIEGAPEQTLIEVLPGTYDVNRTFELATPGLVLRGVDDTGEPAPPGAVVLRGRRGTEVGIAITGSAASPSTPIAVENVTLTGLLDTGLMLQGARGFRVLNVAAIDNVEYGIRAIGSSRGRIEGAHVSGQRRAGIAIEVCERCDIRVEDVVADNNFVGLVGDNAGSLVVRSSSFTANASGIVLRSVGTRSPHIQQGAHVYDNDVRDNANTEAPRPSIFALSEALELPVGAGIWVQGGWHDVIETNRVSGNHYGIVITGSTVPSNGGRVSTNVLGANTVDLGWDGLGTGSCFSGNTAQASLEGDKTAPLVSEPAQIQTLYPCSSTATVGVPYPKVTADLATFAYANYYCHEIDGRSCR